MLTSDDLNQIKNIVQDTVLDSEKRIRKDMATKDDLISLESSIRKDMTTKKDLISTKSKLLAHITQVKYDKQQFTQEGVDLVIDTIETMFPVKISSSI